MNISGQPKFVYNPINITQYGLQEYSCFIIDKDEKHIPNFLRIADWVVKNQDKKTGKWLYNFPYDVGGMGVTLESGWASAMEQGQAMSLLVRAYYYTGNPEYLKSAELGLKPLYVDVSQGGLMKKYNGYWYYEEYPTTPPSYTLNGFMFTLIGLYDLKCANPDSGAAYLYDEGMKTLVYMLPLYDYPDKKISYYHLGFITNPHREPVTSYFYHCVHVIELNALNSVKNDAQLEKYYKLWGGYLM
jgi:hypothetical protein